MNPASFDMIDGLPHYKLFINGTWLRSSRNTLADDINPATGKVFARTQQAGAEEVDKAIAAADAAAAIWGKAMVSEREIVLLRAVDVIVRRTAEIRDMLIEECGSAFSKALWEIEYVVDALRSAAGDARHVMGETMPMTMPGQIRFRCVNRSASSRGLRHSIRPSCCR